MIQLIKMANNCVTPNLDKLIDNGTNLSNCFVAGASCAPSRAALFTGYYPHMIYYQWCIMEENLDK